MPKLLMLKGLPASGKSTRAKEILKQGNWIRVNRDLLREMLHDGKWSGRNEDMTVQIERAIAREALGAGLNVVVDDTNLNPKNEGMWRMVTDIAGGSFEKETIELPIEECIERDFKRANSVGRDVIVGMALQWNLFPVPDKGFVLCDLDGTLCDITHRLKYAKGEEKDWTKFFQGIPGDSPRHEVMEILSKAHYEEGRKIILVSARPDTYRKQTTDWLDTYMGHIPYEALIMRGENDKRDDVLVKGDMYEKFFKNYPIEAVIDDRPKVIRMWREKGLNVIDVGSGEEF
jgi:predicted kinase